MKRTPTLVQKPEPVIMMSQVMVSGKEEVIDLVTHQLLAGLLH